MVSSYEIIFGYAALMSSDVSSNAEGRSDTEALNTYCGVQYWYQASGGDKEASQSWSSLSGFRVEGRPPDHEALMLNTTANSCKNCIKLFPTYLAEDESPIIESG
jgi:hypothetical protein